VRIALIDGAGHSPNVEKPEQVAPLILEFVADQGDEAASEHPPSDVGRKRAAAKRRQKQRRAARKQAARQKQEQGQAGGGHPADQPVGSG
jgi:hypothetical protein